MRVTFELLKMKLKTVHWVLVSTLLTVIWLAFMAGLSYKYLVEKDPVPVDQWSSEHRPR